MTKKRRLPFGLSREFILYGFIGGTGALIDLVLYLFFYHLLSIPPGIASFISVSFGILNNFILNSRFNFKVKDHALFRFLTFYAIGVGGAILSAIIIIVLYDGLGINATVAKLITIVPVVILQFFLNKRFSFNPRADVKNSLKHFKSWLSSNKWLFLILAIFSVFSLFLVKQLPLTAPNGGPDESIHYQYNVEFLIENKRLPVSGIDDVEALSTCRENPVGKVPCIYSYQVYPALNYIVTGVIALVFHSTFDVSLLTGARLASTIFGILFIIFIYAAARRITKSSPISALITASVSLIPQVIFIFSYVNQDAFSLMVAALATYSIALIYSTRSAGSMILSGVVVGGLLAVTKYNYFVLYLPILIALTIFLVRGIITKKNLILLLGSALLSALLIAAFWYVRNYFLYNDALGQSFVINEMQKYHTLGTALPIASVDTLQLFTSMNFFEALYYSFFASFGYMSLYLDTWYYGVLLLGLIGAIIAFFVVTSNQKNNQVRSSLFIFAGLTITLIVLVAMVYVNSAVYDFQPQGRYLFPILPVTAIALALWYTISRQFRWILIILVGCIAFLYLPVINLLIRSYL